MSARVRALGLAVITALIIASPASAEETGAEMGEVTFRVTLSGPVDPADGFHVMTHCPMASCQPPSIPGVTFPDPYEHSVVACSPTRIDHPVCSATTFEWTIEVEPGPLDYRFIRTRDLLGAQEELPQVNGTWQVHSGRQVISLGYVYPSASPTLPDTALPPP